VVELPTYFGVDYRHGLLSDNALAAEPQPTTPRPVLIFSHHILFDYVVTRCVLYDSAQPLQLLERLDEDPSLAFDRTSDPGRLDRIRSGAQFGGPIGVGGRSWPAW
jgi:hypothetical protein